MPKSSVTITLKSDLSALGYLRKRLRAFLKALPDEIERNRIVLAVDEAVANIIIHGYGKSGTTGEINIEMLRDAGELVFILTDNAPPFNPLEHVGDDASGHAASMKSGGLGIHSYLKLMSARYTRDENGLNRLILSRGDTGC